MTGSTTAGAARAAGVLARISPDIPLAPAHLLYPLFVHEGTGVQPIRSLPGCARLDVDGLLREVEAAAEQGIRGVLLFPAIPDAKKSPRGDESWNPDGLIPRAVAALRVELPEVDVITDVALDPYSSDGHDGVVGEGGEIMNDETLLVLCRQAVAQADAGATVIAPSDMMDGRVGAIRRALDGAGHGGVRILSYTAKYASALYGPFRDALESAPRFGDKRTYQMDLANRREAVRELRLDEREGADAVMVKPASAYLDVVAELREHTTLPLAGYQVSGEYAMIAAGAEDGLVDERAAVLGSLRDIQRAGADLVVTYYARRAAEWLKEG